MSDNSTNVLEQVKAFADRSHGSQVRKYTGERYIVHPVRVMETVRQYQDDVSVLSAALLHDVLEDTPVGSEEIRKKLTELMDASKADKAVRLIIELTDIFVKADYPGMNRRRRKENEAKRLGEVSPDAQTIKYADIIDNVTDIVKQDADFAKVFVAEAKRMLAAMQLGHPVLRKKAIDLVNQSLYDLKKSATTP